MNSRVMIIIKKEMFLSRSSLIVEILVIAGLKMDLNTIIRCYIFALNWIIVGIWFCFSPEEGSLFPRGCCHKVDEVMLYEVALMGGGEKILP